MAIVTIFCSSLAGSEEVGRKAAQRLGYEVSGPEFLARVGQRHSVPEEKLRRAMEGPPFFFNKYTLARERCLACIKDFLGEEAAKDKLVYVGWAGHLIPRDIGHVLKVGLVATHEFRIKTAASTLGLAEKEASRRIQKDDEAMAEWTQYLFRTTPWDKKLYDIIVPMHETPVDRAVDIVCENAGKPALATTEEALGRLWDFQLATKVEFALLAKGYHEEVACRSGKATIEVNKCMMRQEHYEGELKKAACEVPGVREAETKVGVGFRQPSIYPRLDDLEIPSKILLVDDEKEFVHTLSERLQTRRMDSEIAYDGEQALAAVADEEPEVMILDLKMPGIDGLEVLRNVKREHPDVEVIILTGHGSEQEQRLAQELGAFAYLQKPVDINVLTRTMKEAYKRMGERKVERSSEK